MNQQQGHEAEIVFELEASKRGFAVGAPRASDLPYDFFVEKNGTVKRVQVKSCSRFIETDGGGTYKLRCRPFRGVYDANSFDVLAALVVPTGTWYIVPMSEIKTVDPQFYPHRDNPKGFYEKYKDAWEVLEDAGD